MSARVSAGITFAAIVIAFLVLVWLGQRRLIYFPATESPSLDRSGLSGAEPVAFDTADGLRLNGWFLPGTGSVPRITILVFNGNAGHRGYRTPFADALRRHGFHVLLIDYRGYGGNPGAPSEEGLAADARAARAYLLTRPDVDPARIVYFGESLGAAVAVRLASEHPPVALILRSPFASLADVGRHHYPLLPVRLLLRDRFASVDRAPQLRSPVLIIAGNRDGIVPIEHSRRLYEGIVVRKEFVELAADHNDGELLDGDEMIQAIVRFINTTASDSALPSRTRSPAR